MPDLALQLAGGRATPYSSRQLPSCGLSEKGPSSEKEEGWPSLKLQKSRTSWVLGMSVSLTLRKEDTATPTLPIARLYPWGSPVVPVNARATDCSTLPDPQNHVIFITTVPEMKGGEINPSPLWKQIAVSIGHSGSREAGEILAGSKLCFIAQFHSNFQAMFSKAQVGSSCNSMCYNSFLKDPYS